MDIGFVFNKKIKHYWLFALCLFIAIYFSFQTICGNRNIYRLISLKNEIAQAKQTSQKLHSEKERLQQLVDRLSDKSLDLDLLDERIRVVLNMTADNEFIILNE